MTKSSIIYNDVNSQMVNLFKCCSINPYRMKKELEKHRPQDPELFIRFRDEVFNIGIESRIDEPDFDIAAKFAYIQTQIFAGNTLSNKSKITILDRSKYRSKYEQLIDKLKNPKILNSLSKITDFENLDFEDCIMKHDRDGMLFYIDPPYFDCERYYTIGKKDIHNRLSECINTVKGKVIISYYEFDGLRKMYSSDKFNFVKYGINCQNGNRLKKHSSKREEILIKNF